MVIETTAAEERLGIELAETVTEGVIAGADDLELMIHLNQT